MTVKPVTYFQIACDAPDCDAICPNQTWAEHSAWSTAETAWLDAEDDGWMQVVGGKHLCCDCAPIEQEDSE